jgi:hypothetical protein
LYLRGYLRKFRYQEKQETSGELLTVLFLRNKYGVIKKNISAALNLTLVCVVNEGEYFK